MIVRSARWGPAIRGRTLISSATILRYVSLFNAAGKKFEEAKQSFLSGASVEYVCQSCGEPVSEDTEYCPHCGDGPVEPVE